MATRDSTEAQSPPPGHSAPLGKGASGTLAGAFVRGETKAQAASGDTIGAASQALPSLAAPDAIHLPDAIDLIEFPESTSAVAPWLAEDLLLVDAPPWPKVVLPCDPSGWASFGERGRVLPAPTRIARQPIEMLAVPDIAVEWADLHELSVRGLSIRGHGHRHDGSVRQDQLAVGERENSLVCAVADGLGTQSASHLGAALVARMAVSWPRVDALLAERVPQMDCSVLSESLRSRAQKHRLDPDLLSTTLTFAVVARTPVKQPDGVPRWHVAIAQIGDSHAYLLQSDCSWTRVTTSDGMSSELPSNVVDPLPKYSDARVWHLDLAPGDVLALTTDGVGNLLEDQPGFAHALAAGWKQSAPSPAALLYVLDAAVKSYDDDRTFLAIRFGSAP